MQVGRRRRRLVAGGIGASNPIAATLRHRGAGQGVCGVWLEPQGSRPDVGPSSSSSTPPCGWIGLTRHRPPKGPAWPSHPPPLLPPPSSRQTQCALTGSEPSTAAPLRRHVTPSPDRWGEASWMYLRCKHSYACLSTTIEPDEYTPRYTHSRQQ